MRCFWMSESHPAKPVKIKENPVKTLQRKNRSANNSYIMSRDTQGKTPTKSTFSMK